MLNRTEIKNILQNSYTRENWLKLIKSISNEPLLYNKPKKLDLKSEIVKTSYELGSFDTSDGMKIGLYEIEIADNIQIERNRVGLRNLLRKQYKQVDGCFAVYYQGSKWRFSYISETREFENDEWIESKTEPKRYTYVLGEKERVNTAVKRFEILFLSTKKLQDIKDAFSVEKVTKEFFERIAKLFSQLTGGDRKDGSTIVHFKPLLKLPGNNDKKELQEFAVRLIGRIVFCWFLNKKISHNGIPLIPSNILSLESVRNNGNYYHSVLEVLFFEALNTRNEDRNKKIAEGTYKDVPFLNGGLFEPNDDDYYKPSLINSLVIPDNWFMELFAVLEDYNFTIDENTSVDIELSVDPEMLGRIFENLLAEINPETGETARKSTGSYYTPREIVEYMIDESLKQYIKKTTSITDEKLEQLVSYRSQDIRLNKEDKLNILTAIDNVKILDPACGSGAFPIGALQKMLLILQKIDPNSELWFEKMVSTIDDKALIEQVKHKFENENLNFIRKFGLIQKCIYGVDIQIIAVELSKLRCFLTLIVDEEIDDSKPNRGIIPLPNLEFKFVAANTLVDLEEETHNISLFDESVQISKLEELRNEYFVASGKFKEEVESAFLKVQKNISSIISQRREHSGRSLQLANWEPFEHVSSSWFNPKWMFGIKDGFNIIIGNPPYISAVTMARSIEIKKYFRIKYPEATGAYDIYVLFILKAINLLNKNGFYSWIIPNKFLISDYSQSTKNKLTSLGSVTSIDVSIFGVFENTNVYPILLCGDITSGNSNLKEYLINKYDDLQLRKFVQPIMLESHSTFNDFKILFSSGTTGFEANKIKKYITNKSGVSSIPFIVSGAIDKYYYVNRDIRYMGSKFDKAYIKYTDNISESKWKFWNNPKIVIAGMTKNIEAVYVESPLALGVGVYGIYDWKNFNPWYLTGILNSHYLSYYLKIKFKDKHLAGGYLAINKSTLQFLPLVSSEHQEKIGHIVEYIQIMKFNDSANEAITYFETIIDRIAYELFVIDRKVKSDYKIIDLISNFPKPSNNLDVSKIIKQIESIYSEISKCEHPVYKIITKL